MNFETSRTTTATARLVPDTTDLAARPDAEDGLPLPQRHLAIAVILATLVLVVLDIAIANVALPSIAHDLGVSASASVWVVTSYQLAVVVALLPCAALGESYGGRRVFVSGIALFTAASGLSAIAPTLPALAVARFVQGLGAGATMALGAMMLRHSCPKRLQGSVIGWNATTIALAAAAGPGLGGAILSVAPWPWLFAINLPIGIAALAAARALPQPAGTGRRLDLWAVALNAAFFLGMVTGADRFAAHKLEGSALLLAAALSLAALVRRERQREAPLIPVDLFRNRSLRIAAIASVCCFTGQMMSYVALPFYLRHGFGLSVAATGLCMVPWPLAVAVAAPISARLANRVSTAWLCAAGGTCLALGLCLVAVAPVHAGLVPLILGTVLAGAGFGLFQPANNRVLLLSAPLARSGAAGGLQGTARLSGQTLGSIGMSLLFAAAPVALAPRIGIAAAAGCALAAAAISLSRLKEDRLASV